ncbi:MAG: 50S ribosomal protein L11 methyltransferase [Gemmatimonadales bacterium]
MSWWAVETRPPADAREAVAQWLARETGQAALERDDGAVVGYVTEEDAARRLAGRLVSAFGQVPEPALQPVAVEDWSVRWRDGIAIRTIGRLTVGPSWLLEPGAGRVVVDPEMAFGTGEHGSTRSVLALLQRHLVPGTRVLDVGSGSAILAIAAAQLGARRALGIEIDPEAEPVARKNLARNGVDAVVELLTGDAEALAPLLGPVELIVSNILRSVNTSLLPTLRETLAEGGLAIFGGMELVERDDFLPELAAGGFTPVDEAEDAGWWAVAARAR